MNGYAGMESREKMQWVWREGRKRLLPVVFTVWMRPFLTAPPVPPTVRFLPRHDALQDRWKFTLAYAITLELQSL